MPRQECEGVSIRLTDADIILNSKTQWHQPQMLRFIALRGNTKEEEGSRGENIPNVNVSTSVSTAQNVSTINSVSTGRMRDQGTDSDGGDIRAGR